MLLDVPRIELPSSAFRGTRDIETPSLGPGRPRSAYEVLADAALVHHHTGAAPRVGLELPLDHADDYADLGTHAAELGITIGSLRPPTRSTADAVPDICHPDGWVRRRALDRLVDAAHAAQALRAGRLLLRLSAADRYPGAAEVVARTDRLAEALATLAERTAVPLVVDYTVTGPTPYRGQPDWRALLDRGMHPGVDFLVDVARDAPAEAFELTDSPIHRLAHAGRLGGIVLPPQHADTQDFATFLAIVEATEAGALDKAVPLTVTLTGTRPGGLASVMSAVLGVQEAIAKASIVDLGRLRTLMRRREERAVTALLVEAFEADVSHLIVAHRAAHGIADDPLRAYDRACHAHYVAAQRQASARRAAERRYRVHPVTLSPPAPSVVGLAERAAERGLG